MVDRSRRETATPHRTRFHLEYEEDRTASTVESSLAQEIGEINDDRSRTVLGREGRTVTIEIEAADLVALRAAGNTWLGLAAVAERTEAAAERRGFPPTE